MSNKIEGRSLSHQDLIDDIVESSSNRISKDTSKILQNRNYLSQSNLSKFEQTDNSTTTLTNELRDRLHLTLPRSNSSTIMMTNDERRKEIDLIIKHLYDGKLLSTITDDHPTSEVSESSIHMLSRGPITTTMTIKTDDENKNNLGNIDLLSFDDDITSLQRELQEKEIDVIHLHKEIQELQLENKLLKAKVPTVYSNGYTNNNSEIEGLHRERDILKNELHISQELIAKFQQQQHQNIIIARSNKIDDIILQQKQALEQKIRLYEKHMRTLTNENDKLKQNFHQTERILTQYKQDNEQLQQKITEVKKRNDELFHQEFNSLRNDLKILKQRNNELFEENLHLQQISNTSSKHLKIVRSESPNISEASDSTNYLTTVSLEHYNTRPLTSIHRTIKYNSLIEQKAINSIPSSKTKHNGELNNDNIQTNQDVTNYDDDHQTTDDSKLSSNFYQTNYPIHRSTTSNDSRRTTNNQQDDRHQIRKNTEITRRPYAPSTINDIHVNDIIKFSRPGGKISKGIVKYIGILPGKPDKYLGLELENEESKHDGIYQDQRLFQCKPNKGVFVGFNKVIMAWSEK